MKDKIGWIVYFICIVSIVLCGIRGAWALGDDFHERDNLIAYSFAERNETGDVQLRMNWKIEFLMTNTITIEYNEQKYIYKLQENQNENTGSRESI